ncbi:hypothetical protein M0805_006202 [Coniferiporia weirii]|nr:hypothetical protein M0805_006202 [Coniferiporia weirii]
MIIKEDKLAQLEPEPLVETPPPYSLAPEGSVRAVLTLDTNANTNGGVSVSVPPAHPAQSSAVASGSTRSTVVTAVAAVPPPPTNVPRTSCVHIRRENRQLAGSFVIDPYLPFPPTERTGSESSDDDDMGISLGGGEEGSGHDRRPNLRLECQNRSIDANVWVVGGNNAEGAGGALRRKKAILDMRAKDGYAVVKINASEDSPAFALRVGACNGGIRVGIPRSFVGPLTTRTHNGWVRLEPALAACTTHFSEVNGMRKGFVGDFASSGYGEDEWHGSSIDVSCENGRIKLFYLDEEKVASGWFERLFGMK